MDKSEKNRVSKIRNGDEQAFERLFFEYYTPLCKYSMKIVKSRSLAKDAVQEVFMKIWKGRENWHIYHSIKVYLYQAVRNQSLNYLEKKNRQHNLKEELAKDFEEESNLKKEQDQKDHTFISKSTLQLIKSIWIIAEGMPERRKTVFTLHRKDGLSYKEIGTVMGITPKTVENHMALALKTIRQEIDPNKLHNVAI